MNWEYVGDYRYSITHTGRAGNCEVCKKYTPDMYLQRIQEKMLCPKDFEINGKKFFKGDILHKEKECLFGHYECLIKARR